MTARAYYNENDPFAAAWLRELIKRDLIAPGDVDERSIADVSAGDVAGYTQCHFFAGIGGWSYALRLAGWADDQPVWTGSCPCQPFSGAASQVDFGPKAKADIRHLWPVWWPLIRELQPNVVFGEQVKQAIGWGWLDEMALDFESASYAVAPIIVRSDAYQAVHERQRLYWVADSNSSGWQRHQHAKSALPKSTQARHAINSDSLVTARRLLEAGVDGVLPGDGVSINMERGKLKGYGNAIVPQVAAEFIGAYMDITR